jgi:hypothetical protein
MKMKPILFSTKMVQAILEGRKSMTRRVAKKIPQGTHRIENNGDGAFEVFWGGTNLGTFFDGSTKIKCPYGKPGDILWVRETWREQPVGEDDHIEIQYRADFTEEELGCYGRRGGHAPRKWKSSRFMPRSAARIFLRVKDVRVERIQDITAEDAKAEGLLPHGCQKDITGICPTGCTCFSPRERFAGLWDDLNAKRGYGWDTNCWVFVIEFERCSPV